MAVQLSDHRCECGCGAFTSVAKLTCRKRGLLAGKPVRFVPGHNHWRLPAVSSRYRSKHIPSHDGANASGCVVEHVLKAERALGRSIPQGAQVHHVDGNSHNNANANLVICDSAAYHRLLHYRQRMISMGVNPSTHRVCSLCRAVLTLDSFNKASRNKSTGLQSGCRVCVGARSKQRIRRFAAEHLSINIPDPEGFV